MISVGLGYLVNHEVLTKFAIDVAFLSLYSVISNYSVTGLIILTGFKIKFYLFPFLSIM